MDFWNFMINKDTFFIRNAEKIGNVLNRVRFYKINKVNRFLRNKENSRIVIIFNGPSIQTQNLEKLKVEDLMFVNRGFKHASYAYLKPKYHIFIDPKMLHGVWPIEWIDKIKSISPSTKIILPAHWSTYAKFSNFLADSSIIWWPINKFSCMGVSGECFRISMYMKYGEIYFTGFEATGLANELANTSKTHFYGANEEDNFKDNTKISKDLYTYSRQLRDLEDFSNYAAHKNVKMVNLTDGGLLQMFNRMNFIDFIASIENL